MGLYLKLFNAKSRKNFFDYFLYIFKYPGMEKSHLNRILIETLIVIVILVYYIFSVNNQKLYYLLFILYYIYELRSFYIKLKEKYFNKNIFLNHKYNKNLEKFNEISTSLKKWEIHSFFDDRHNSLILFSENLNKELKSFNTTITINSKKHESVLEFIKNNWNSHGNYLHYKFIQSREINKDFFNDEKICLGSDLPILDNENNVDNVDIYFGTYFDSVLTNEACGTLYENTETGGKNLEITIESFCESGKIRDIASSKCNNHIGVSTLAITKDKKMVIWTQNSKTQQNSNQFIPTGSGSLDKNDLCINGTKIDSLKEIIIAGGNRELCEECEIEYENIVRTEVIGYWRWIERGGKPEFSNISLLNIDSDQLTPSVTEIKKIGDNNILILDIEDENFENEVTDLLQNRKSSLPLLASLYFFLEFKKDEKRYNSLWQD